MASNDPQQILIIGAGLAALALAQGLEKHGIPFTVFERDSSSVYRPQGYRIKTFEQTDADLRYLLRPHIFDQFQKSCAETVPGESAYNALNGVMLASRRGWKPRPWTVDREVLRNVLLLDIGDKVQFNREFVRYEAFADETGQGPRVVARFADGTSATGRLIIGADGIKSRVRGQRLGEHHRVVDALGMCIYGKTPFSPELEARFPAKALRWITTYRDEAPVLTQITTAREDVITLFIDPMRWPHRAEAGVRVPLPDDYVYWAMLLHRRAVPASWAPGGFDPSTPINLVGEPAKDLSLEITAEWEPSIRSAIELQDASKTAAVPVFCTDPESLSWKPSAEVTLLGDAVHGMPPTGAIGAVTAIHDAAVLAEQLVHHGITKDSIGSYEKSMQEYATAGIRKSQLAGKILWNQGPLSEGVVL